jgi:pyruvate dehydrogenase E2 component (dihydrolipoamide acetyltransferase)
MMTDEIVVPQVGEAVDEVLLVRWFKQEGEQVRKGEPLFEVDTDKVTMEVEAFADGILQRILAPEGSAVMPQQVVGLLDSNIDPQPLSSNDGKTDGRISPLAPALGVETVGLAGSGPGRRVMAESDSADDVRRLADGPNLIRQQPERVLASPKARRLAQELGVALNGLTGTGVEGLIRVRDVEAAQAAIPAATATAEGAPLSRLRQAIAASTQASKQTVPHFYLMADVDMSQVQTLRSYCTETLGWSKAPTYTEILVRAAALALIALPDCNVSLVDGRIVQRRDADVGVVVGVPGGLLTPVIAHADRLSLAAVAARLGEVAERARGNRLRAEDVGGKSLVISNLGMYAVDSFIAIIEQPAPMILAAGRISDRVVAVNGQPAVRPIGTLTLSADHRVLDGIPAAQFLTQVVRHLEQPFALLGVTSNE